MTKHEIKREIRQYYGINGGRIKVKLDRGTFILKRGECLTVEILLPPTILRQINLQKLGID